jgi:folate-dependent phosphoribosylglycinamide formyltransferase PurN
VRPLRVAFFGSPAFALPSLEALLRRHDVVMVVSQPDKPSGRGMRLTAPPVAARARELGLELWQPTRLRKDEAFLSRLRELELDVAVTAAYGRVLPPVVLEAPRHGVLNVHASLLPRHRGAAPVQWALIAGDVETGVTIMQTEEGLDTGPIRLQRRTPVREDEDAASLMERLSRLGAEALTEALDLLAEGTLPSTPQDDALATYAPLSSARGRPRSVPRREHVAGDVFRAWRRAREGDGHGRGRRRASGAGAAGRRPLGGVASGRAGHGLGRRGRVAAGEGRRGRRGAPAPQAVRGARDDGTRVGQRPRRRGGDTSWLGSR